MESSLCVATVANRRRLQTVSCKVVCTGGEKIQLQVSKHEAVQTVYTLPASQFIIQLYTTVPCHAMPYVPEWLETS